MEQLKEFVERELETSKRVCKTREEMLKSCSFCLGAVQFAQVAKIVTYDEVVEWWDSIREEFWFGEFGAE